MNIQPENLHAQGYVQTDALSHQELIPFVQLYLKKNNVYTIFYKVFNLVLAIVLATLVGYGLGKEIIGLSKLISQISFGFVIAFLLLPIHEGLHGYAYKKVGAPKVSYAAEWRKLYFMAIADRFVANRKEFNFVALLPFAVITFVGLVSALFLPFPWILTALSTVLIHGSMCGGDFALLGFFREKQHLDVVTYDDVPNKISYFFEKPL